MTHLRNDDRRKRSDLKLSNTQGGRTALVVSTSEERPGSCCPGRRPCLRRSGHITSHMLSHRTSTQRNRVAATSPSRRRRVSASLSLLEVPAGAKATRGSGRADRATPAPIVVNQTKRAIIAVMQQLGRPVTSDELQKIWAEHKALGIFEYHLSTLVKAKVAEVAYGPELHFRLVRGA